MYHQRIFFLHNPKAGGSSLRSLFSRLIGDQGVAPVFSNAPEDHRSNAARISEFTGFQLYAGHYGFDAYRRLSEGHLLFTNFRDPVRRVQSMYRYWRNNVSESHLATLDPSDRQVVRLAKEMSFPEFIRHRSDDLQLYISNFHFRQLHSSGWERPPIDQAAISTVKRRISRMPWFYLAETPDCSSRLLAQLFSLD